jgi:hypothetical protein
VKAATGALTTVDVEVGVSDGGTVEVGVLVRAGGNVAVGDRVIVGLGV